MDKIGYDWWEIKRAEKMGLLGDSNPSNSDIELFTEDIIEKSDDNNRIEKGELYNAELKEKANKMGFFKFRSWAKREFNVTGRSVDGIIKDILSLN